MEEDLKRLVEALKNANQVTVLTGAGVSKESGIPTFREAQTGLWAQYDPMELATPEAFLRNPKLVWEWYAWRRGLVGKAEPNAGHFTLVELENKTPKFTLITQNVDSLHERAGSKNIIELHGNITRTKCFDNHHIVSEWIEGEDIPPKCPECGSMLRPDVVWFNEGLPPDALQSAHQASQSADVFLSIGTSALVQPAASLPLLAKQPGAVLVEINPAETQITPYADIVLPGASGEVLPALLEKFNR